MSNWASVIVVWSGVDNFARPHEERAKAIADLMGHKKYIFSPPCGPGALGQACESVMVTHQNHFWPQQDAWDDNGNDLGKLWPLIIAMPWEHPEEVQIIYKTEHDIKYRVYP